MEKHEENDVKTVSQQISTITTTLSDELRQKLQCDLIAKNSCQYPEHVLRFILQIKCRPLFKGGKQSILALNE